MSDENGLELQRHNLEYLEQEITGLKIGRFPPNQRPVHVGIIKKGLEDIRRNIVERDKHWENIKKLESLEANFAELEERVQSFV
jgi:hypothetical protein